MSTNPAGDETKPSSEINLYTFAIVATVIVLSILYMYYWMVDPEKRDLIFPIYQQAFSGILIFLILALFLIDKGLPSSIGIEYIILITAVYIAFMPLLYILKHSPLVLVLWMVFCVATLFLIREDRGVAILFLIPTINLLIVMQMVMKRKHILHRSPPPTENGNDEDGIEMNELDVPTRDRTDSDDVARRALSILQKYQRELKLAKREVEKTQDTLAKYEKAMKRPDLKDRPRYKFFKAAQERAEAANEKYKNILANRIDLGEMYTEV